MKKDSIYWITDLVANPPVKKIIPFWIKVAKNANDVLKIALLVILNLHSSANPANYTTVLTT